MDRSQYSGVVGVGETQVGKLPGRTSLSLYAEAIERAAEDASLRVTDIDCLITGNSRVQPYLYHSEAVAEYMGIQPSRCLTTGTGGSTTISLVRHAQALVDARQCSNVIVAVADNLATGLGTDGTVESMAGIGHPQYEAPYGVFIPGLYALVAQRYLFEFGISPLDLAEVAVSDRMHATLNPAAQYRTPISAEDVIASKLISDPLHLYECAPISDGGCAVVVGHSDRARSVGKQTVALEGFGESHRYEHLIHSGDVVNTGAAESGLQAYTEAGIGPSEIDVAYVYDAFAFIQCMQLEDLGFCKKGEGAAFVASGATRPGGSLPVNTHGGVLSHSHAGKPSALFQLVEAVRQLRDECGERQIAGVTTALVHAEGGILASHSTMILRAARD